MHKLYPVFIVITLIATGCARSLPYKASTSTYTAGSEAEYRDGSQRVNDFMQELLSRGFRIVSTTNSESWAQITLIGDYGELKDAEVVFRIGKIGKQLETKEPHFGATIQANVTGKVAEQEFDRLDARLKSAIQGK